LQAASPSTPGGPPAPRRPLLLLPPHLRLSSQAVPPLCGPCRSDLYARHRQRRLRPGREAVLTREKRRRQHGRALHPHEHRSRMAHSVHHPVKIRGAALRCRRCLAALASHARLQTHHATVGVFRAAQRHQGRRRLPRRRRRALATMTVACPMVRICPGATAICLDATQVARRHAATRVWAQMRRRPQAVRLRPPPTAPLSARCLLLPHPLPSAAAQTPPPLLLSFPSRAAPTAAASVRVGHRAQRS